MLLSRIINHLPSTTLHPSLYLFSRNSSFKSSKQKYENKSSDFESLQSEYAKDYFQNYRKEVEKDTVIRDFRKQIFSKNNQFDGAVKKLDEQFDKEQNKINRLLNQGSREQINQYSKKVMQNVLNKRDTFKGKEGKDIFKDYANYSAYKTNYVTIEDRNYEDNDMLNRSRTESRSYQFIDSLPDQYHEKKAIRNEINIMHPVEAADLSISQYGRRLQARHDESQRLDELRAEDIEQNSFKMKKKTTLLPESTYQSFEAAYNVDAGESFQLTMLSSEVKNKIYDLYLQGWSVREISRRFGILPMRTKFVIWARARLYNELLPKHGLKFLLQSMSQEEQQMSNNHVLDYGMDLEQMTKTDGYQQIDGWENERVDVQRKPEQYTQALRALEKVKKTNPFDMVQVGTYGKQNKKHLLKDWKIYRGKKSDDYFLKNKVFRKLMEENRKIRAVYF